MGLIKRLEDAVKGTPAGSSSTQVSARDLKDIIADNKRMAQELEEKGRSGR